MSTRAAVRSAASLRWRVCSRRSTSTRSRRWRRCPREPKRGAGRGEPVERAPWRNRDALDTTRTWPFRPRPGTVPGQGWTGHGRRKQKCRGSSTTARAERVLGRRAPAGRYGLSAPELVTVTVDGQEARVPKGTGLVETALVAGIEIPVFCYEPRLGAAIGACRMCLCEVEGMPKLQAACTMTAQDGMTVHTAQTSAKAAEGQEATLEFILVNHPLDCPVCDKGGECPLQDLTFRWGPGNTRMHFPKRTFDKPIPISPLIGLDRERCNLCYRCTRFSELVAEDGQLVAVNRGAQSIIATFEDE